MLDRICVCPSHRIGIIGGGQLGKMMTNAAKQMGFDVTILDPTLDCPAGQVADRQVVAAYNDQGAITKLAQACQVVTYEFEHIDSEILIKLVNEGHHIYPSPSILQVIQNKLTQKQTLLEAGLPVAPFLPVAEKDDILMAAEKWGYPLVLKSCTGGYDGKGNFVIKTADAIEEGLSLLAGAKLMVEAYIPFNCEVSVMVVGSKSQEIRTYPLSENIHEDNILKVGIVPARVSEIIAQRAGEIAAKAINVFQGIGVFCIEMFVTENGEVLVNEVAPRPHNSGHYTIEACVTSQFEQHIRAICDLPLGDTSLLRPAVMVNLLGEENHSGRALLTGCAQALALPGVSLHFYGKKQTQPSRKMGHVTITAPTLEEALVYSEKVANSLKVLALDGEE